MKTTHVLICLLLLAADVAVPLASATHTTETDVPLGPPPQVGEEAPVDTGFMPVDQLQEDLIEMVGPPANKALVDLYDQYHAQRAEIEELSSRGLIRPYQDGMGMDARDGAGVSDPDRRLGGFGEWEVIGDNSWEIQENAARTGVAGYTSATLSDGTYRSNVQSLLLSPELDLRTGANQTVGAGPGTILNLAKEHAYATDQPQDALYEFFFNTRYNLGFRQDSVNIIVFTKKPASALWEQGEPNESPVSYSAPFGIVQVAVPGSKRVDCTNEFPPCWEFVEPIGQPYDETNEGHRAFTGRSAEWTTYQVDLSKWAEKQIWIGFSFQTAGTPSGYFQNEKLFDPDLGFYGFQMDDARLEMPTKPYNLRARTPELAPAQIPSKQTGLAELPTVPADQSIPLTFDAVNMGLEEAVIKATIRLYEGLGPTADKTPLDTWDDLEARNVPAGQVTRFTYDLPAQSNPNIDGTRYTVEVEVEDQATSYKAFPTDPDADPDDNTKLREFNVITFEDVHAGRLTQTSSTAGFGEPVTFELPVRNLGNSEVVVEADACAVDLLRETPACSDELFSHGEGTLRSAAVAAGGEHTFQWVAKGSAAGQYRIFARAGTDLATMPGFSPDDLRTDLLEPLRSRHVETIALDGSTEGEPVWLQAPNPVLPGGGSLRILNSDTHIFLAIKSQHTVRLLLDDLADHRALRAHDGGVLAQVNATTDTLAWNDLQLDPSGLAWSASGGDEPISQVAYDADEGQYEIAIPMGVAAPEEDIFAGLTATPGDFVGLMLKQVGNDQTGIIDPYPRNARSSDGAVNGNGDLTDELYIWQPIRLGTPDDVVSDDTVRRFQFRGLSAGLGIERSPPSILQEDFHQCPDLSQWVQENIVTVQDKTEKWNCAEYGPDRRLVLYEGLSPDSVCGSKACSPWSELGGDGTHVDDWPGTTDSGVVYTPPFRIDSSQPYLFLQHQYATESWIVDKPGFTGSLSDHSNFHSLGHSVWTNVIKDWVLDEPVLEVRSAGRVYLQVWDDDAHEWQERVLLRPEDGYPTDETIGIVDPRFDERRQVSTNDERFADDLTLNAEGLGFWWPTGFQPLYRGPQDSIASGADFQGSPWAFDRFPLFGSHEPFQGPMSAVPFSIVGLERPAPESLDLLGKTVRIVFDFERSQGDGTRDYGWRIGGLAVADAERFQRDLAVEEVRIGDLLYDPSRIGVGPGTEIPVLVTLSNQGSADLPGIHLAVRGLDAQDPGATPLCQWDEEFPVSIAAGEAREFEVPCTLPADGEGSVLLLQVEAASRAGDDFLPNNRRNAKDLYELRSTPDVAVKTTADPGVASRDVGRTVTIVLENRGNVPVSDFEVELQMQQVLGAGTTEALGAARTWRVTSELPVNTRLRVDDPRLETEPPVERSQLSFKPAEQGTFEAVARVVSAIDLDPSNDAETATMRARSRIYQETLDRTPFAEPSTVSGERNTTGTEGVWRVHGGSHDGSRRLYAGNPLTEEIPANASAHIILPDLDLTTVKSATLTMKHRYALEEGFDGARLELSADGGETWQALRPQPQPLGGLPQGYPSIPMLGVNPLLDGKAEATAVAFSGNSAELNASQTDTFGRPTGWVTSEFDLSSHPHLQRQTAIDAFALHGFESEPEDLPEIASSGDHQFRHASWILDEPAAEGNQRYWWIQDATHDITPHSGESAWWSGSAGTEAEGMKDVNTVLTYHTTVPEQEGDRRIFTSWWEYRAGSGDTDDRRGTGGEFLVRVEPEATPPILSEAIVAEEDGVWVKREIEITEFSGQEISIRFEYKSVNQHESVIPSKVQNNLGWLIDDLALTSYEIDQGTGLRTKPIEHLRDDMESSYLSEWTVLREGWHRTEAVTERGTVWNVQLEDLPGQGKKPVWRFGDQDEETKQGYPHGVDTRLVTPLIDLTQAVGDEARLRFDHRYGFESRLVCSQSGCEAKGAFLSALDGGAVEVQVFNETTGSFEPWKQIGAHFRDFPSIRFESEQENPGNPSGPHAANSIDGIIEESGYPAVEEKGWIVPRVVSSGGHCRELYVDGPLAPNGAGSTFEVQNGLARWTFHPCSNERPDDVRHLNWRDYGFSFVFSGDSGGWQNVDWDISPLIGQKVRFAFHAVSNPSLTEPYKVNAAEVPYAGWSIANVAIEGSMFQGSPIKARLHLATDGSLTKGEWSVDDIELVGDRYKDNVAIIAGTDPEIHVERGGQVTLDGVVANLGTNPRGVLALAVQALDEDKQPYDVEVWFDEEVLEKVPLHMLPSGMQKGHGPFSLRPGGQAGSTLPFHINMTLPEEDDVITLRVQVLEAGDPVEVNGKTEFTYVLPSNEVSGNTFTAWTVIGRTLTELRALPALTGGQIHMNPAAPRVGEPVMLTSRLQNDGTTTPDITARWSILEVLRKGDPDKQPGLDAEVSTVVMPAEDSFGELQRSHIAESQQTFTPERPGLYRAVVEYLVNGRVETRADWEFLVDVPANYYQVDFSQVTGTTGWIDRSPAPDQTHGGSPDPIRFRHDGSSLIWGVDARQLAQGKDYCDFGGCVFSASANPRQAAPVTGLDGIGDSPLIDLRRVPQGEALVALTHSMRFYPGDGARLEAVPYRQTSDGAFEPAITCNSREASFVLLPMDPTAYDGTARVASTPKILPAIPMGDSNEYNVPERRHPFAASGERFPMMEAARQEETLLFDLSRPATSTDGSCKTESVSLVNYTISLRLHAGQRPGYTDPNGRSDSRDGSQGWQIHEVSVSSIAVDVTPGQRRFPVLDGAPKSFGFNVRNAGQAQETFLLSLDRNESTLPDPSWIRLSSDEAILSAGDTQTVPFEVNIPPDPNLSRGAYTARLEARSASSPSIVDFIDVVLDLQSNPLPDLSVSLSTDDGGQTITQGSISPVYVTVRNLGQVESKPVRVQLSAMDETGARTPIETLDLDALCPQVQCGGGSRRTLAADWLVPELTGNYTIIADVDVDGRLLEESLHNNHANLLVEVVPLAVPDLAVTALEVEGVAADGFAEEGDLLVYRATVQNLGLAEARNVQVQILADSALLAEESIPVLAAGQSREVTAFKVGSRGETIALVHVLPDDRELNTDNNQFKQSVRVRGHDLSASLVPARPLLEPGAVATVILNVTNGGNTVERLLVSLEDAPGWSVSVTPDPLFVAPGRNGTASLRIQVAEDAVAGVPAIRLVIAPATNAGAAVFIDAPFEVESVGGAPLLESDGTTTAPGPVDLPVNVTSTTNAPQRITLRLASPDWKHEPLDLSLRPHKLLPLNLSMTIPAGTAVGNHTLQLESVDADGTVLSQTVATVAVLEQRRVEAAWSEVRTSRFAEVGNQSFEVSLRAVNTGNVPVELTLVPTDLAQNTSAQTLVGRALEPGAAQTLVLRVDSEADALSPLFGNVQVWMRPAGAEGRGTLAHTLALPAPTDAADLHVVRLDLSPRTLHAGETVRVSAVVENQGVLLSNTSRMHIYLNGALLEDLEVPAVAPGENAVVNATWTVQRSGTYHVVVLADAEGSVGELEETNNGLTRTLDVEDTPFVPGFVERHVPALPLLPLLLVCLAGAWLRRRDGA